MELITRRLGLAPCGGCQQRKAILNRLGELPKPLQHAAIILIRRGLLTLLVLLPLLGGCKAFGESWAEAGRVFAREVTPILVTSLAASNSQFANALDKAQVTPDDIRGAVDAGFAAARGDFGTVVDRSIDALERRIPGTPNGPPLPEPEPGGPMNGLGWDTLGLGLLYIANQVRKNMRNGRGGGGGGGNSSGNRPPGT